MGKRSKAKKQQNAVVEEDAEVEPVEEELDFEKEDNVDSVPWKGSEPKYTDDDSGELDFEKEDDSSEPPQIKKTHLFVGILLLGIGYFGVLGLRLGIIQPILGISDPYPGIGSAEPMGHVVSMIPFVLGLVAVAFWGIKNDSIYNEIENAKKNSQDDRDVPRKVESEEFEEEVDEEESEVIREEPVNVKAKPKEIEPEEEVVGEITQADVPDEFNESLAELEDELNGTFEEPKEDPEALRKKAAEEDLVRIQRCEKMLNAIVVLPDDKKHLKGLIVKGTSTEEFSQEVKQAVERRKKKEQEKNVTAEEKASILEDELVAELGELGDDDDNEVSLEDEIIKELEDLDEL